MGYSESDLLHVKRDFENELGPLVQYVIDNFREGDSLKFNKEKETFNSSTTLSSQSNSSSMSRFEDILKQRGITDPYTQCAKNKTSKKVLNS